jgi:hypothetical protein
MTNNQTQVPYEGVFPAIAIYFRPSEPHVLLIC